MKKSTRSILQELSNIGSVDRKLTIENRGKNLIESISNLLTLIYEEYDEAIAYELEKRLISSIKNRNTKKFLTGINKIHS